MQYGGLKLRDPEKYELSGKIGFDPITNMINSPDSELKLLTYRSLKGIMFILNVLPEHTEYLGLDENFTIDKPITSFVLKVVIISVGDKEIPLWPYQDTKNENYPKYTETENSFFEECKLQQKIWEKSIRGGREPICPSVANLVFFANYESKDMLNFFMIKLQNQTPLDIESERAINYLLDMLRNANYRLSIMTMPAVENTLTLEDFKIHNNLNQVNNAIIYAMAQMLRLFIEIHVIHFDLHSHNVLVYPDGMGGVKCFLIDFGSASDLENPILNKFINDENVRQFYLEEASNYYDNFFNLRNSTDVKKTKIVKDIANIVGRADQIENNRIFQFDDPRRFQMLWIQILPNNLFKDVFNIANQLMIVPIPEKLSLTTIQRYKRQNYLINFDGKTPNDFLSTSFWIGLCDRISGICTISGGKNKKSRNRKSRNRKSRNRKSRNRKSRK